MNADALRLAAALLVAAIHTGPLGDLSPAADLVLCRGIARLAVPYFWMLSGRFVLARGPQSVRRQVKRLLALYAAASLAYLPLSLYAGYWTGAMTALRRLLWGETFYHLWYLPATALGLALAAWLDRRAGPRGALAAAGLLYLAGLWGNGWYPLAQRLPALRAFADALLTVFGTTRNGLFFAPLFLLLGRYSDRICSRLPRWGLTLALPAMAAEVLWLHGLGTPPNDSMYLLLPLCAVCLFRLVRFAPPRPALRRWAGLFYLAHPMGIAAVRGLARLTGLRPLLVENDLVHYLAVCLLTLAVCAPFAFWPFRRRPDPTGRAWTELDRTALAHNVAVLRAALPAGCRLMPAVKADAYGHGAVPVARTLRTLGVDAFCVACLAEGIALRRAGIRGEILILGYTSPADFPLLRRWRLTQTVADADHAARLAAYGHGLRVHIALDTGMRRLGLPCGDIDAIARIFACKGLRVTGLFTHLCTDGTLLPADMAFAQRQLDAFDAACRALATWGIALPARHVQSSTGILRHPGLCYELARPGIALYGLLETPEVTDRWGAALRPVLSLRCRVAAVRALAPGEGAGYGLAFTAARPTRLATLTIGYADGVPRSLSGAGAVLLRGRRAPIVGRVCMDQLLADVTGLPDVAPGDVATLIGRDGDAELTAGEAAAAAGTISNELLSRLGPRLPRIWRQAT